MRRVFSLACLLLSLHGLAQRQQIVKLNATALLLKNVSGQYEVSLSKKFSAALGFRFMPNTGLPFKNTLANWSDGNEDVRSAITNATLRNFAITPELRYYLGKGAGRGFYVAPYYRYTRFSTDYVPVNYTGALLNGKRTITISGDVSAHNGGLLLGAQWLLGKRLALDWWIVGAHIGSGKGLITGRPDQPLNSIEQAEVRRNLEELDIPFVNKRVSVSANNVTVDFDGRFGGLRSGLLIGLRL